MQKSYQSLELNKILSLLADKTTCEDARELALELTPTTSLEKARLLMQETADAHMLMAKFGSPAFGTLKNVNNSLSRAESGGVLNTRELMNIAEDLRVIRALNSWRQDSAVKTSIDGLFYSLMPNKFLEERITGAIIGEEEFADTASPQLYEIRRKIRTASSKARERLEKLTHSSMAKYLQEAIVTIRNGRFVVPVRAECRSEINGLVHDMSSSGATIFVEPTAVVEANNEIKMLESKERDEIERILAELSALAGSFYASIKSSYENAVYLNLVFAKAKLAYDMKASAPELNDEGVIRLKKARHPLIDPAEVVATDITLGETFTTLVITGPNTGGKTVSIKTIGLLTLMAMCGLMIPVADQSRVSVFKNILADIGDEQSIEQSLSTFSAHMTNIIDILNKADDKSLILIDELGSGTDPVEGAALATAILEKLYAKGAVVAATTHYAEIKAYAIKTPGVENGSCEFDVKTLKPTYKLLIGIPGRSNAFAISKRLGMEQDIIDRATELVSGENTEFEDVVAGLEEKRRIYEEKTAEAEKILLEAHKQREEAEKVKASIDDVKEKELEKARGEALRLVENAKRAARTLSLEIEQLRKDKDRQKDNLDYARKARQLIKRSLGELDDVTNPVYEFYDDGEDTPLPDNVKVGDRVFIKSMRCEGTITALEDKRGQIEVRAGSMKMRIKKDNLKYLGEKKEDKEQGKKRTVKTTGDNLEVAAPGMNELDIRGMNVEEGTLEVDRFLDRAVRMNLNEVTIIHGKGTGLLRKGIQAYLKGHPAVKSFRAGNLGEGDTGVTVVEIK